MPTVHEDEHGVFIKHDGNIYRPQTNEHYFPFPILSGRDSFPAISSKYKKGDKVKARRYSGCLWAYVGTGNNLTDEYWSYHGCYVSKKEPSKNFFNRR